jgi:hypothetical protein
MLTALIILCLALACFAIGVAVERYRADTE